MGPAEPSTHQLGLRKRATWWKTVIVHIWVTPACVCVNCELWNKGGILNCNVQSLKKVFDSTFWKPNKARIFKSLLLQSCLYIVAQSGHFWQLQRHNFATCLRKMYKAILIALKLLMWCWRRYSVHNGYPCTPSQRKEVLLEPKWATVQATCIHLSAAGTVTLSSNISEDTAADSAHIYRAAETSDCWRNCAESICRQHTQGVQSAAYSNTETLFIGSHMPPLSHTEFNKSFPSPAVGVSLFAQKHCVNLRSALWKTWLQSSFSQGLSVVLFYTKVFIHTTAPYLFQICLYGESNVQKGNILSFLIP